MKLKALSGALAATALLLSTTASAAAATPAPVMEPATEVVTGASELDSISGVSPALLVVGALAVVLVVYFVFIDDDDDDEDVDVPTSP